MNTDTMPRPKVHHGKNIKKFREILDIKQETIAFELNLTQQAISKLEAKEVIDDETLNKISKVLNIPVEAIKNMGEEATYSFVANTFHDFQSSFLNNPINCTFNPIDKIVELYERLLEAEKEKNKK